VSRKDSSSEQRSLLQDETKKKNNQGPSAAAAVTNNECLSAYSMSPLSLESQPVPLQSQRVSLDQSHSEQGCASSGTAYKIQKTPSTVCSQSYDMNLVAKNDSMAAAQALTTADGDQVLQKDSQSNPVSSSKPKCKLLRSLKTLHSTSSDEEACLGLKKQGIHP
jgi:hypothetical protein